MRALSTLLVLAVATAAAVMSAGCGSSLPNPATAVKAAAHNAEDARTARFEIAVEVSSVDFDYRTTAEGAIDFDRKRSYMRFDDGSGDEQEEIAIDEKVYRRTVEEDTWYVLPGGASFGDEAVFSGDFGGLLKDLGADSKHVERVGTEELRGKKTTHYRGEADVDHDEFLALAKDATFDLWLDADGRPAKLVVHGTVDFSNVLTGEDLDLDPFEVSLTMEFFDYGAPVDIEAPPEDQVVEEPEVDLDDFLRNPFEGAECHGERLDGCVEPNPELAAIAQDPALCQGETARVCLVPVGAVRKDVVEAIVDFHRETANIELVVLPSMPVPPSGIRRETSQVTEQSIINSVKMAYGVKDDTPSTYIAITPIDIVPEDDKYGWMFGARFGNGPFGHNHGVFSYFRMANVEPYDGEPITDALLHERVAKYAARYTALLYLDYPVTRDIDFLNYYEMYGFSDLDEMGTRWPEGDRPCFGEEEIICVVPDNDWDNPKFQSDLEDVIARIDAELEIRVEILTPTSFYPTKDSWSEEFRTDLLSKMYGYLRRPGLTVVGVTDDPFAQAKSVPPHIDAVWPDDHIAVVSGADAGKPGTAEHRERLYRLIIRAITRAHYGVSLSNGGTSILSDDIATPADLDGRSVPDLP